MTRESNSTKTEPRAPVPVQVQPLHYMLATRAVRLPKKIIALGVAAIVMATISVLASIFITAIGVGFSFRIFTRSVSFLTIVMSCENLISVFLAIYLFVVGILVMCGHPRGDRLQEIFAWIKIPLTIIGMISLLWPDLDFTLTSHLAVNVWFPLATGIVFSCGYPILLLIVLRKPGVRAFYRRARLPK